MRAIHIPVGREDLPAVQHIRQRNGTVLAPVVEGLGVVDEDDEVIGGALVEDLGGGVVGTRHCDG